MLRLRGFDVTAKGKTPGSLSEYLSRQHSFEAWLNADGTAAKPVLTHDWMLSKGYKSMTENATGNISRRHVRKKGFIFLPSAGEVAAGTQPFCNVLQMED